MLHHYFTHKRVFVYFFVFG